MLRIIPADSAPALLTDEQREQEHRRREVEEQRTELRIKIDNNKRLGVTTRRKKETLEKDLAALDSKQGQQISMLKKSFPEVARGLEWLEGHGDEFEKKIFGPPLLTCSVKDQQYSTLVQSLLQMDDFLCFTAQTRNDHKRLSEQFYKKMGLSVTIRTCSTPLDQFRSPMTANELSEVGLDGFAVDYLEGPGPVMAMLCSEKRLHLAAVGLNDISEAQFERIKADDKLLQWAAGNVYYRITRRREYGSIGISTMTRSVRPGKYWTDGPVDAEEKTELQQKVNEAASELQELAATHKSITEEELRIRASEDEIGREIVSVIRRLQYLMLMFRTARVEEGKERAPAGVQ
jgi:structural maintenance of chromosomes protein 5